MAVELLFDWDAENIRGRVLVAVWTMRGERIRAVTADGATAFYRRLYMELTRG